MNGLFSAIRTTASISRKHVAIGVVKPPTPALVTGLKEATKFADIVVVGTPVEGFESIPAGGDRAASDGLMSLIQKKQVHAIVRGQIYYTDYHESMKLAFGFTRDVMCPCLLRDICGNEWFITPVVHHDDDSVDGRCYLATQAANICTRLGVEPVVGVLAPDSERGFMREVDEGLDEAEAIVKKLTARGLKAKMFPLRIDSAASETNIVVPMDGIVGNFVCRSLAYLGGATLVGGFTLTNRIISLDTSRSNDRFLPAIESAAAMANLGGMPVEEYAFE
jgi:predicted methyltransferase MtxX (methanogen marker protein 4)